MSTRILPDHHYVEIAAFGLDQGVLKDGETARDFATALREINIARFRDRHPEIDARALPGALTVEDARRWHGGVIAHRIEALCYQLEGDDRDDWRQQFLILDKLYELAIADNGGVATPDRWAPP